MNFSINISIAVEIDINLHVSIDIMYIPGMYTCINSKFNSNKFMNA